MYLLSSFHNFTHPIFQLRESELKGTHIVPDRSNNTPLFATIPFKYHLTFLRRIIYLNQSSFFPLMPTLSLLISLSQIISLSTINPTVFSLLPQNTKISTYPQHQYNANSPRTAQLSYTGSYLPTSPHSPYTNYSYYTTHPGDRTRSVARRGRRR